MDKVTAIMETKAITTGYNLFLTPDEAAVLLTVTGKVTGLPSGNRYAIDCIRRGLIAAKVIAFPPEIAGGSINF